MWAFGGTLYTLITFKLPFTGETEYWVYKAIQEHKFTFPKRFDQDVLEKK